MVQPVLDSEVNVVIEVKSTPGVVPRDRLMWNKLLDQATPSRAGVELEDTQGKFRAYSERALRTLDFLNDVSKAGLRIMGVLVSTTYERVRAKRSGTAHGYDVFD